MSTFKRKQAVLVLGAGVLSLAGVSDAHALTEDGAENTNSRIGHLDVSVDYKHLEDAISLAESQGVSVFRDGTEVRIGNYEDTKKAITEASDYYRQKAEEITAMAQKYQSDLAAYEQAVAKNKKDADLANAEMDALKTSLAALGRHVTFTSLDYSETAKAQAKQRVETAVQEGQELRDLRSAVERFHTVQNAMVGFQTQADMGNIKVTREVVKVSSLADVERYSGLVRDNYTEMTNYVNGLSAEAGSVDDAQKPSYTLYDVVIADDLLTRVNQPVEIPHFSPLPVDKVVAPQATYHFFDIRQVSDALSVVKNKDSERIVVADKSGKTPIHQAMVNQTIQIDTASDPLPEGRFDKYHAITVTTHMPTVEEIDIREDLINTNNPKWSITIDKAKRMMIAKATDDYLLEINESQAVRNGTITGIQDQPFTLDMPELFVKLLKDNHRYIFSSDVMINHQYKASSGNVIIRTDEANPHKTNKGNNGMSLDDQTVWFGTVNNYNITVDFDQYKGVNIDKEMQAKGLHVIDFYPADALDVSLDGAVIKEKDSGRVIGRSTPDGSFVGEDGAVIEGVRLQLTDGYEGIDRKGPAIVFGISGYDHPWYKTYVEGGKSLTVVLPMTTKIIDNTPNEDGGVYGGNSYTNVSYQDDFGNIYKSNEVTTHVTSMDPRKDAVLAISDLTSMDLKSNPQSAIEHGSYFYYRASGSRIDFKALFPNDPTNTEGRLPLDSVSMTDIFHDADQYDGIYFAESNGDLFFKEGTSYYNRYKATGGKLALNADITKYTTQHITRNISDSINTPTGLVEAADGKLSKVVVTFDKDFLDAIDTSRSTWQVDVFFQTKRAKDVDGVTNVFTEEVNGLTFGSTRVTTNSKPNSLDLMRERISGVDKKVDDVKTEMMTSVDKVKEDLAANSKLDTERAKAQDEINKAVVDTLTSHNAAIGENRGSILSLRRLVTAHNDTIAKMGDAVIANKEAVTTVTKTAEENKASIAEVAEKVREQYSRLTIYLPEIVTESDALSYATDQGVAPRSIKSIEKNEDGRFVVTYNTAPTAVTSSKPARSPEAKKEVVKPETAQVTETLTLYTTNDVAKARQELETMGYKPEVISDIVPLADRVVVTIRKEKPTTEAPKVDEPKVEVPKKLDFMFADFFKSLGF